MRIGGGRERGAGVLSRAISAQSNRGGPPDQSVGVAPRGSCEGGELASRRRRRPVCVEKRPCLQIGPEGRPSEETARACLPKVTKGQQKVGTRPRILPLALHGFL